MQQGDGLRPKLDWDPTSPSAWAHALGMVRVPLFGVSKGQEHSVLLDGHRASFAVLAEQDLQQDIDPANWTWSSFLNHAVVLEPRSGLMSLRRWDARTQIRRFRLPKTRQAARDFLRLVESSPDPRGTDVVIHILRAFRSIRNLVESPLEAINVLNALLLGTEAARKNTIDQEAWLAAKSLDEALAQIPETTRGLVRPKLTVDSARTPLGNLLEFLLGPEPISNCELDPSLLLRHASSQLYQDAHLFLERDPQLTFFVPHETTPGTPIQKDVRFTPPSLARSLAEQASASFFEKNPGAQEIDILDPACGSGVFLQEILRELATRGFAGKIRLRGIDNSTISCAIARFCLERVRLDHPELEARLETTITEADALVENWGQPDIVLMNPPFVAWESTGKADRVQLQTILGNLAKGRPDKSMAFLWRATQSIGTGGTVASVLPAAMLETASAEGMREILQQTMHVKLVGRFDSSNYFRGAIVETAFVVMTKSHTLNGDLSMSMLYAKQGHEDEALRILRLDQGGEFAAVRNESEAQVTRTSTRLLTPTSWTPRGEITTRLLEEVSRRKIPTVSNLFDVRQGSRTGMNDAFVLSVSELETLPKRERKFFRPAAGNSTIRGGRLVSNEVVFFPYQPDGTVSISSEVELRRELPRYYELFLEPNKAQLRKRAGVGPRWWTLTRERQWQVRKLPKLVSTYFGDSGSFAFDAEGEFVVVQGHAWVWKRQNESESIEAALLPFASSPLPWAYAALLNSRTFERLLSHYCPRVQGGQFNLSKRFVDAVPIPDLSESTRALSSDLVTLSDAGRRLQDGIALTSDIEGLTERLYGLSSLHP